MVYFSDQLPERLSCNTAHHVQYGKFNICDLHTEWYALVFHRSLCSMKDQLIEITCILSQEAILKQVGKHRITVLRNKWMTDGNPLHAVSGTDTADRAVPVSQQLQ